MLMKIVNENRDAFDILASCMLLFYPRENYES